MHQGLINVTTGDVVAEKPVGGSLCWLELVMWPCAAPPDVAFRTSYIIRRVHSSRAASWVLCKDRITDSSKVRTGRPQASLLGSTANEERYTVPVICKQNMFWDIFTKKGQQCFWLLTVSSWIMCRFNWAVFPPYASLFYTWGKKPINCSRVSVFPSRNSNPSCIGQ